jgi:hAT family C-terminal dimerisation region
MAALAPPQTTDLRDELDRYLSTDVEHVTDPLAWWYERRTTYPCLSRMALDYLTIPGMYFSLYIQWLPPHTAFNSDFGGCRTTVQSWSFDTLARAITSQCSIHSRAIVSGLLEPA